MNKSKIKSVSIFAAIAAIVGAAAGIFTYKKRHGKSKPLDIRSANDAPEYGGTQDEGKVFAVEKEKAGLTAEEETNTDLDEKENILL